MNEVKSSHFSLRRSLLVASLPFCVLLCGIVTPLRAADIYVAQTALGAATGADAADAYPISWLNASISWGFAAGEIGPGTTVHLVGIITNTISIQGSGSPGNPLTVLFEPNTLMASPVWSGSAGYCAIYGAGLHDVVISGGVNGAITATDCGDLLDNKTGCNGVVLVDATRVTVENLSISNLFVRYQNSTNEVAGCSGIVLKSGGSTLGANGNVVTNCSLHDMGTGVSVAYGPGWTNMTVAGCTISNINWGIQVGDGNPSCTINGFLGKGNHIHGFGNWDDAGNLYHHDGIIVYANSGSATNIVLNGNHLGPGFGAGTSAAAYLNTYIYNELIYNNIFDCSDGSSPHDGMLFTFLNAPTYSWAGVFNNDFIGVNNGVGIEWSSGYSPAVTCLYATNNLFVNVTMAVEQQDAATASMKFDYNLYCGVPLYGGGFSVSANTSANYLSYTNVAGIGSAFAGWQNYGFDPHGIICADTTPDVSGNYNGILVGNPGETTGIWSNAMMFCVNPLPVNTNMTMVRTTLTNLDFSGGSGTITWWERPSTAYNSSQIRPIWGQGTSGYTTPELSCQVFADNNWYVGWHATGNDARVVVPATALNYPQNQSNFYALTWSQAGTGLSMNGIQIGTNSTPPPESVINSDFCIAAIGSAVGGAFPGSIEDVRVYNVVKSPAALNNIKSYPSVPLDTTNLVARWPLNEIDNPVICMTDDTVEMQSPAIGAGVNLSSYFNTDYKGNPRPAGTNGWTIGAFEPMANGSLTVQISPSDAVAAGAGWQLDDGVVQTNGMVLTNVYVGQHVVGFTPAPGWITPSNVTVTVTTNILTVTEAYAGVPGAGGLQVLIQPAAAVLAGAEWQTNGGPLEPASTIITPVPGGTVTLNFNNIPGWTAPASISVPISSGLLTTTNVTYVLGSPSTNTTPQVSTNGPTPWNANLQVFAIQGGTAQVQTTNSEGTGSNGAVTNDLNGIVAWWPLDDTSGADLSGNGYTLTYYGNPSASKGEITNAVQFSGRSQYAVSSLSNLKFSSGTVTWWQNPSTAFNSSAPRAIWGQLTSGTGPPEFSCQVFADNNWYVGWHTVANDARIVFPASSANYVQGAWNFYAVTWSPVGTGILMNGAQIATNSTTPTMSDVGFGFCVGTIGNQSPSWFSGALDDVRIYNRVLSPAEIANQYQWPVGGRP